MRTTRFDVSLLPHQLPVFRWHDAKFIQYVKGRRAGGTAGAARKCIQWLHKSPTGRPLRQLWLDLTHRNIIKYQNLYMLPALAGIPSALWSLNKQEMTLKMTSFGGGTGGSVDFGSLEQGEKLEGYAYDVIWINEAGHVLKAEDFIWTTILPMAIEGEGAKIFSIGAPKGRTGLFETFANRGKKGSGDYDPMYYTIHHTSFENPLLNHEAIEKYTRDMPNWMYRQEIMAEFVASAEQFFKAEWFLIVDSYPASACSHVRYWDCAASKVKMKNGVAVSDPDATSGTLSAWHPIDRLEFIVNIETFRDGPAEVRRRIINTALRDPKGTTVVIEQEPGSLGRIAISTLQDELSAFNINCVADPPTGAKTARAQPLAGFAESGRLRLLRGSWNSKFIREAEAFPKGQHDDQVDSTSGAHMFLVKQGASLSSGITGAWVAESRNTDWG